MNTKFSYEYRDGDNYKAHETIILKGELTKKEIQNMLDHCLSEGFLPRQVGLKPIQYKLQLLDETHNFNEDGDYDPYMGGNDHVFHTIDEYSFESTKEPSTEEFTVHDLYNRFKSVDWNIEEELDYLLNNPVR